MTAAAIVFDPDTHTSRTPDGRDVPHVTTVLKAVGLTTNYGELGAISARVAENILVARARGDAMHADCHAYDDDDLVWDSVDPMVRPYVAAWATCRENMGLVPVVRERQVYHPLYHYTGIMDGIFARTNMPDDWRVLLDLKSGDPDDAAAHLQTAAYEGAYLAEHPNARIDERWAVWLRPGLRVPYRTINYTARPEAYLDFRKFTAALTTYNEQPARRRKV